MLRMLKHFFFVCIYVCAVIFQGTHQHERKICQTSACFEIADSLKKSINQNVNPCDNFYAYACGNWPKTHATGTEFWPSDSKAVRSEENILELQNFLESPNVDDEPESVHKARKLYSLCMDTEKLDEKEIEPLKYILTQVGLSPDPPINRNSINFDLFLTLIKLQKYVGINPFFKVSVAPDPYDKTVNRATIWKNEPEKYSLFSVQVQKQMKRILSSISVEYILQISKIMCENSKSEVCTVLMNVTDGLGAAIAFNPLINYLEETYKLFVKTNLGSVPKIFTLEELQNFTDDIALETETETPKIDWLQFFSSYFSDIEDLTLDKNFEIVVRDPQNLRQAFLFIYSNGDELASGLSTIELGLWWDVVHSLALLSGSSLRNFAEKFLFDLMHPFSRRENYCANTVKKHLGRAVSYYYTKNSTYGYIKEEVHELIDNLDFKSLIISETSWMDNKTKQKALEKLEDLKILLVYPEKFVESKRQLKITDDLLETLINSNIKKFSIISSYITKINDFSLQRDIFLPCSVHIINDLESNKLIAPAGILGMWKVNSSLNAFNYGSLGSLIIAQILHTFDYSGKQYDNKGNIANWWESETLTEYKKQEECFRKKSGANFSTTDELEAQKYDIIIAEAALNAGLKQALLAYKKYEKKTDDELALPEFENLTNDQLFTLGFANIWCGNSEVITTENMRYADCSLNNSVIVNKAITQLEEFKNIWKCAEGSSMNTEIKKCSLW